MRTSANAASGNEKISEATPRQSQCVTDRQCRQRQQQYAAGDAETVQRAMQLDRHVVLTRKEVRLEQVENFRAEQDADYGGGERQRRTPYRKTRVPAEKDTRQHPPPAAQIHIAK